MKKVSKFNSLFCALICMIAAQSTNNFASAQGAAIAAHHHTVVKDLDEALCQCIQKYLPLLEDINLLNLKSKVSHIENLRTDLLFNIKRAEQRSHFILLEQALEKFNSSNPMTAAADFKKVIAILPSKTKALLQKAVTDPFVKSFLGL